LESPLTIATALAWITLSADRSTFANSFATTCRQHGLIVISSSDHFIIKNSPIIAKKSNQNMMLILTCVLLLATRTSTQSAVIVNLLVAIDAIDISVSKQGLEIP
jgi:hypothetical protein